MDTVIRVNKKVGWDRKDRISIFVLFLIFFSLDYTNVV